MIVCYIPRLMGYNFWLLNWLPYGLNTMTTPTTSVCIEFTCIKYALRSYDNLYTKKR